MLLPHSGSGYIGALMATLPCLLKRHIHPAHLKATRYLVGTITSSRPFKLMVQPASIIYGSRLVITSINMNVKQTTKQSAATLFFCIVYS